ncbi:uncharacterized protein LOC117315383 [Pecten maximus]|uniref:uncharacterized protein LOC117315383 n=1 Tax=Pecten maximus TaxID=6579 RepID=UPI0014580030|nr:uncharacterized protein LOC117315383 [Pecten maximus]
MATILILYAFYSVFHSEPEQNTLETQPSTATPIIDEGHGKQASRQPRYDVKGDSGHQGFIEPIPDLNENYRKKKDNFLSILDVPDEDAQSFHSHRDIIENSQIRQTFRNQNPTVPKLPNTITHTGFHPHDGLNIMRIPEEDLFSQDSFPEYNSASYNSRTIKKPLKEQTSGVKEQTSGVIRIVNKGLDQRRMTPWGAGKAITKIKTISESPEIMQPENRWTKNRSPEMTYYFPGIESRHGDVKSIRDMLLSLHSSGFRKSPTVVLTDRHAHETPTR